MPHSNRRTCGSFQYRRPSVDCELRFTVQNDEHLFALIMEMRADAALRLDDPAMEEVQIRVERRCIEQTHVVELPWSSMHARRHAIFCGFGAGDPLCQRSARRGR